ncbi:MAG: deoxyribonuclease IV [Candidatus Marinimicrobia bacterium]|nr:deoxyribonuclease IV [Candidatus Neomarinimicrobiota bacterium]
MPLIGCHISISGGVENAPARGKQLGCDAMQIFTSNQMQWKGRPITDEAKVNYLKSMKENNIKVTISHDSYLINLGSPDKAKLEKSRQAFLEEIDRCDKLGIELLVFHPGSHMGKGEDYCLKIIAESIDYMVEQRPDSNISFVLETTAGQGSNVGYTFEQLRKIIELSSYPERFGICFDTCHAYAAGYDIVSFKGYKDTWTKFDDILGLERLKVFHLNDSKKELGSRIDRHCNLGDGYLGWETFYKIINDERFKELPMILETPGGDENYAKEIAILKKALKNK